MNPLISNLCVLFCPCVLRKATVHVGTKALNMRHQAKKGFHGIFVGIPQHQKWYLVYIPSTRKIISSYDVVFDETVLVCEHICQNLMHKKWLCVRLCHAHLVLNLQREKLAIKSRSHSLKRVIYDLKLVTMQKVVTNLTKIKLCNTN